MKKPVIGSLNMDTAIETPYPPKPGKTLTGRSAILVPGGRTKNSTVHLDSTFKIG